jgi:hypothetical protein
LTNYHVQTDEIDTPTGNVTSPNINFYFPLDIVMIMLYRT